MTSRMIFMGTLLTLVSISGVASAHTGGVAARDARQAEEVERNNSSWEVGLSQSFGLLGNSTTLLSVDRALVRPGIEDGHRGVVLDVTAGAGVELSLFDTRSFEGRLGLEGGYQLPKQKMWRDASGSFRGIKTFTFGAYVNGTYNPEWTHSFLGEISTTHLIGRTQGVFVDIETPRNWSFLISAGTERSIWAKTLEDEGFKGSGVRSETNYYSNEWWTPTLGLQVSKRI